jgi:NAD+ synthase (glutamine-hydrolysing)
MDGMVEATIVTFTTLLGAAWRPKFQSRGGTLAEDLALQNIQARLRMVFVYFLAQLLPWVRGRTGWLLVLGSANVDEALRGYFTKYDCSAADLNPIGAVSKLDLKRFMLYAADKYGYGTLKDIVGAPPTAELRPMEGDGSGEDEGGEHSQTDEEDMGMSYEELGWYGRLRKMEWSGPLTMFRKLSHAWSHLAPTVVASKVKKFFFYYAINRHKMTVITPSYHAESYSPDDNRFDHRPFLYPAKFSRQFSAIDAEASAMEAAGVEVTRTSGAPAAEAS